MNRTYLVRTGVALGTELKLSLITIATNRTVIAEVVTLSQRESAEPAVRAYRRLRAGVCTGLAGRARDETRGVKTVRVRAEIAGRAHDGARAGGVVTGRAVETVALARGRLVLALRAGRARRRSSAGGVLTGLAVSAGRGTGRDRVRAGGAVCTRGGRRRRVLTSVAG